MMEYKNKIKKRLARFLFRKEVIIKRDRKIVTFTFDDTPKSAFENAGNILNKFGIRGTFYISLSFLEGQEGNKDLYTVAELQNCISDGHELACHTYNHLHSFHINNQTTIKNDLVKNQSTINDLGFNVQFENFSYPFGEQTLFTKRATSKVYNSCRGIEFGINSGRTDLNNLKAIHLYESINPLEKINKLFQEFDKSGGWLIFYTHDVWKNFSEFGCSQEYFKAIVERSVDSGYEIKSIKETVDELLNKN